MSSVDYPRRELTHACSKTEPTFNKINQSLFLLIEPFAQFNRLEFSVLSFVDLYVGGCGISGHQ